MASCPDPSNRLAVLLTCADWRLHQRAVDLTARMATHLDVDGVDLICVPGPDGLHEPARGGEWAGVVAQMRLLMAVHSPVALAVAGHGRCAGHPVDDMAHDEDVRQTAQRLKAATGFSGPIHAMMLVYRSDRDWDIASVAVI